jgi:hypothetical protein
MSFFQYTQKSDKLDIDLSVKATTTEMPLLPAASASTETEFLRVDLDLVVKILGESQFIPDYFINPVPLKTTDGMILFVDDITAMLQNHPEPLLVAANSTFGLATSSTLEIGTITMTVEGPVTAIAQDGTIRVLNTGDPVYLHDTIVTDARGYIRITLNDDTMFQLGPKSRASLDKYAYDSAASVGEFETYVQSGVFRYVSGKIGNVNLGQHTIIKTPSAHIGIRGSEIEGRVEEDGATTVLHTSGFVNILSRYHTQAVFVYESGTSVHIPSEPLSPSVYQAPSEIQQFRELWSPLNSKGAYDDAALEFTTPTMIDTNSTSHDDRLPPRGGGLQARRDEPSMSRDVFELDGLRPHEAFKLDGLRPHEAFKLDGLRPHEAFKLDGLQPHEVFKLDGLPLPADFKLDGLRLPADFGPDLIGINDEIVIVTTNIARNDVAFTLKNTVLFLSADELLKNDIDNDLQIITVDDAVNGSVSFTESGDIKFIPVPDFMGFTHFKYTVDNGRGGTDSAVVFVTVMPFSLETLLDYLLSPEKSLDDLLPPDLSLEDLPLDKSLEDLLPPGKSLEDLLPPDKSLEDLLPPGKSLEDLLPLDKSLEDLLLSKESQPDVLPSSEETLRTDNRLFSLGSDEVLDFSNIDKLVNHENQLNDSHRVTTIDNTAFVEAGNHSLSLNIYDVLDVYNTNSLVNEGGNVFNSTSQNSYNIDMINISKDALSNSFITTHNELLVSVDVTAQSIYI